MLSKSVLELTSYRLRSEGGLIVQNKLVRSLIRNEAQPRSTWTTKMAAAAEELSNDVGSLTVNDNQEPVTSDTKDNFAERWGFKLPEVYKLALKFYKEKDGKAIHLTYKDKLKLVAYTKQVSQGKCRNDISPEVGFLDVVGSDRRQAWQSLGDMSQDNAMEDFVELLDKLSTLFRPYVDAHKAEHLEKLRKQKEEEERKKIEEAEMEQQRLEEEAKRQLEMERKKQLEQEMQIRTALNQQTAVQFSQYAQQQYPTNKQQQEELIRQLQEQHFQQYMQQVYQQQLFHQQQQYQQLQGMAQTGQPPARPPPPKPQVTHTELTHTAMPLLQNGDNSTTAATAEVTENGPMSTHHPVHVPGNEDAHPDELPPIAAASMWTRKDVKEFKELLCKEKDAVIKIGSGETVTVRVPTHIDGTCLFWEFATDYYDIGFGVYFEWSVAPNNAVSVHISESSDEEELEDEPVEEKGGDIEKGSKRDDRPPTDEIIPVYRRDSHEEVYCGSHAYPGQGVYLLKFDNSYSLWRSKTLYYRVYYSR
ncbi:Golgi resident protein GCP60-like isoform X2 [Mizuhopecten yessoensis]|uniref:Golgi resident protein GCP60-like isoform X2 n=1 Tax=Mizuhopecten yessoensis TaxID=6573 RepID=UPI000B458E10|nr:Golgi resident protein GCP60-like isoform X2 [Mizuhopecten yessoensis]